MKLSHSFLLQRSLLYIIGVIVFVGGVLSLPVLRQTSELLIMRALGKTAVACGCTIIPALSNPIIFTGAFFTSLLLVIGMLRIVFILVHSIIRTRRALQSWHVASSQKLTFQNRSYMLNIVDAPNTIMCSAGIIAPQLYISTTTLLVLNPQELLAAVLHEIGHIRSYHPLHTQLSTTLTKALFFSQFKIFSQYQSLAYEHSADAYALQFVHRSQLLSAITRFFAPIHLSGGISHFSLEESRIKLLLGYEAPKESRAFSPMLITMLITVSAGFFPLTLFARSDTLAQAQWQGTSTCAYVAPPPEEYVCVQDVGQTLIIYPIIK